MSRSVGDRSTGEGTANKKLNSVVHSFISLLSTVNMFCVPIPSQFVFKVLEVQELNMYPAHINNLLSI